MVLNSCHGLKFLVEGRSCNEDQYGDIKNNDIPRYFVFSCNPNFSLLYCIIRLKFSLYFMSKRWYMQNFIAGDCTICHPYKPRYLLTDV